MDPFLDLIQLLRPAATLFTRVEATGSWGLAFHQRDDLLFCWVERGECLLTRPGEETLSLRTDDFVLIRTSTPFALVSDLHANPTDSETVLARAAAIATLGNKPSPEVILRGGKFLFDSANEALLTGLLPQVLHLSADTLASERVRTLLRMNEAESTVPGPGSDFVITRLMELLLVELLRGRATPAESMQPGLVAGLADAVIAQALIAMHSAVARSWTTAKLARLCGISRSALAARFSRVVGLGPIAYLQRWRIALAKDELRQGQRNIDEIARLIGFQSASAFSTAFKRAEGCSPRVFTQIHLRR
ncbi:MAG: AraC family transcriptional regulator [Acidobacteriaceae bacterium]|nr:AraC family transcriptional regulator [Acidobacteriaceae bacterium]